MNLGAPELNLSVDKLQEITSNGKVLDNILTTFGVPKTDSMTLSSYNLLPTSYLTYDENGVPSVLTKKTLDENLNKNISNMTEVVKQNVESSIAKAISVQGQLGIQDDKKELELLTNKLRSDLDKVIEKTQNFILALNSYYKNNIVITNYKIVIDKVIQENIEKFTNKDIRDISDNEEFFNKVSANIISEVLLNLKGEVLKQIELSSKPQTSVQIATNSSLINAFEDRYPLHVYVRVYYTIGDGADPETFDGLTTMNTKLIGGRTCAVDNSTIPLNSLVVMPDGKEFIAMDTFSRSSVRPALYLYFNSREEAEAYLNTIKQNNNEKMLITVIPPSKPPKIKNYNKPSTVSIRGTNKRLV